MSLDTLIIVAAAVVVLVAIGIALRLGARAREHRDRERLAAAREAGLHIPPSLHPVINPDICIGSLACVAACPEGDVLGIVNGVGALVVGANCIGHGRCAAECPVGAIKLVFGTSERGVDIPRVSDHFESNVPGLYIAGELGGMGLIRNAVRQGVAAVRHLAGGLPPGRDGNMDDVIIIGAGPAGIAAALAARERNLRFRVLEQDAFGGTVAHYPRQKLVLAGEIDLPLAGRVVRGNTTKEDLTARWNAIRNDFDLPIQEGERVDDIRPANGAFDVITTRGVYRGRRIVLAIGRRGTPRRLDIPGEDLSTVTYRLIEPEQYAGRSVLVVGGGDSAVEATCVLAESGARAVICHRRSAFDRCRPANRDRLARLGAAGQVELLLGAAPVRFEPSFAHVAPVNGGPAPVGPARKLPAEYVIICAGGELPTALLSRVGVQVDRHHGEAE